MKHILSDNTIWGAESDKINSNFNEFRRIITEDDLTISSGFYSYYNSAIISIDAASLSKAVIDCTGATRISIYSEHVTELADTHDGNYVIFTDENDAVLLADKIDVLADRKYVDYYAPPLATKCYLSYNNSTFHNIFVHYDEFPFEFLKVKLAEVMQPTETWEAYNINFFCVVKHSNRVLYMYYNCRPTSGADNYQHLAFAYSLDDGYTWIKSVPKEVDELVLSGTISALNTDSVSISLNGIAYQITLIGTETSGEDVADTIFDAWTADKVTYFPGWNIVDPAGTGILLFSKIETGECVAPSFADNNSLGIQNSFNRILKGMEEVVADTNIIVDASDGNGWMEFSVLVDDLDSAFPFKIFYNSRESGAGKMYMAKSADGITFTDNRVIASEHRDTQIIASKSYDGNFNLFVRSYLYGIRCIGYMTVSRNGVIIREPWHIDRGFNNYQAPFIRLNNDEYLLFPTIFDPVADTAKITPFYWDGKKLVCSYNDITDKVLGEGYRAWGVICPYFFTGRYKDTYVFFSNGRSSTHGGVGELNSRYYRIEAYISRKTKV